MVREDINYGVVACIQLYSDEGDIHYGVVACIQLYSGEGRHTYNCTVMRETYIMVF